MNKLKFALRRWLGIHEFVIATDRELHNLRVAVAKSKFDSDQALLALEDRIYKLENPKLSVAAKKAAKAK